jgi:D-alanine-D-alanine ligase
MQSIFSVDLFEARMGDAETTFADRMTIREDACPEDRGEVRRLVAKTEFFRPDEVDVAVELVEERLGKGAASGYEFLFAEIGGSVAGYACYGPIACTIGSFDLYWIAVDPAYQRQGLGRLLMREVESRIGAAGGRRIYIDTSGQAKYAPTRSFYERSSFRREATLADFYAPGDDRVIYVKQIPGPPFE